MRVLILSANTGAGHNSTAGAIAEALEKRGAEYEIADALAFISEKVSDFISKGHSYVYRKLPRLFGLGYRFEERHSVRFIYEQCAKGAPALQKKLEEGYDALLCVHVFAGMMVTELRRRGVSLPPTAFLATDYTCSPGVGQLEMDRFYIPHPALTGEFIRNGVPRGRISSTGIPVRSAFFEAPEREEARQLLGLREDARMVLLSCGSMGCGHMEKGALALVEALPSDAFLAVICGSNKKTYEALLPYASERLLVIGFTDRMPLYLSAADLYITKPGGLSTSEAIALRRPMVFIDAVPGCETRNFDFLTRSGVAIGTKNWKQVASAVNRVMSREELAGRQTASMERFSEGRPAAEAICESLLSMAQTASRE